MKNLKTFNEFLTEELKHLPPPSDEETFDADPLKRMNLISKGELDIKFKPTDQELDDVLKPLNAFNTFWKSFNTNYLKGVKMGIDKGYDIHYANDDALFKAVMHQNYDMIKLLVENGANVNAQNNINHTPLMYATEISNFNIVKYLVEHGAYINMISNANPYKPTTAIDYAKNEKIKNYLISKK